MTLRELSQLYYLEKEISDNEKRLEKLRQKGIGSPELSGMPHGSDGTSGPTERLAVELTDLEAIISAQRIQAIHEEARIRRFIADIPRSRTRLIFTYRFIDLLAWESVASILGPPNTAESVRKLCYRYLKESNIETDADDEAFLHG